INNNVNINKNQYGNSFINPLENDFINPLENEYAFNNNNEFDIPNLRLRLPLSLPGGGGGSGGAGRSGMTAIRWINFNFLADTRKTSINKTFSKSPFDTAPGYTGGRRKPGRHSKPKVSLKGAGSHKI